MISLHFVLFLKLFQSNFYGVAAQTIVMTKVLCNDPDPRTNLCINYKFVLEGCFMSIGSHMNVKIQGSSQQNVAR